MELLTPFMGWIIPAILAVFGLFIAFMKGKSGAEKKAKAEAEVIAARHTQAQAEADRAAAQAQVDAVQDRSETERKVSDIPAGKVQEVLIEKWSRD